MCNRIISAFFAMVLTAAAWAQTVIPLNPALNEFPEGVAIDKPGNLWVSIRPLCQVRRYTPDYQEVLRVNLVSGPCIAGLGLAVDANGTAFAAVVTGDPATRGVYQIEPWGDFKRLPGTGDIEFANGVTLDSNNGSLYVSDYARGAVWKIPHGRPAELWIEGGPLVGDFGFPPDPSSHRGANGIAFNRGRVLVAVTWFPRLVSIPVNHDGSAGTPVILVDRPAFFAKTIWALAGLALDVHENLYVVAPAHTYAGTGAVVRVSSDGSEISIAAGPAEGIAATPESVAFGTGKGDRQAIFVTVAPVRGYPGTGCGLVRVPVGVPGLPIP